MIHFLCLKHSRFTKILFFSVVNVQLSRCVKYGIYLCQMESKRCECYLILSNRIEYNSSVINYDDLKWTLTRNEHGISIFSQWVMNNKVVLGWAVEKEIVRQGVNRLSEQSMLVSRSWRNCIMRVAERESVHCYRRATVKPFLIRRW